MPLSPRLLTARQPAVEQAHRPRWRPEIQGLRAVAVLLVIFYHSHLLDGGFVGVDVFFVISGFLISAQLYEASMDRPGRALLDFYARRIRRILPASWLVLVLTVVAGWWFLNPLDWQDLGLDASAAAFFAINFRLASNAIDYLRSDLPPSALQHYWSLAVEEQFYFIWPLIVVVARRASERFVRPAIIVLLIGSLVLMLFADLGEPDRFYGLPTRAWQLLSGALAAHFVFHSSELRQRSQRVVGSWPGIAALVVVAASVVIAGMDSTRWPGPVTIGLSVAIVLLLLAPGQASVQLLGARPLTWIGDRSYSWYLLHFPPMIFLEVSIDDVSPWLLLASSVVTLGAAHVMYERFETPLRHVALSRGRTISLGVAGVLVLGVGFAAASDRLVQFGGDGDTAVTVTGNGWFDTADLDVAALTSSLPGNLRPPLDEARDDRPVIYNNGCHAAFETVVATPCELNSGEGLDVAIFGDSHAAQWVPALQVLAEQEDWTLTSLTKSGCSPADVATFNSALEREYTECVAWRASALSQLEMGEHDVVIFGGSGRFIGGKNEQFFDEAGYEAGLARTIRAIASHTLLLYLEDTPYPDADVPGCIADNLSDISVCVASAEATRTPFRALEVRATKAADVAVVNTNGWLCGATSCPVVIGDVLLYRDGSHITTVASEGLAQVLLAGLIEVGLPQNPGDGGD